MLLTLEVAFHVSDGVISAASAVDVDARKPDLLQLGYGFTLLCESSREIIRNVPEGRAKCLASLVES